MSEEDFDRISQQITLLEKGDPAAPHVADILRELLGHIDRLQNEMEPSNE